MKLKKRSILNGMLKKKTKTRRSVENFCLITWVEQLVSTMKLARKLGNENGVGKQLNITFSVFHIKRILLVFGIIWRNIGRKSRNLKTSMIMCSISSNALEKTCWLCTTSIFVNGHLKRLWTSLYTISW